MEEKAIEFAVCMHKVKLSSPDYLVFDYSYYLWLYEKILSVGPTMKLSLTEWGCFIQTLGGNF